MSNIDYNNAYVECPACDGDGAIHHSDGGYACGVCDAKGTVTHAQRNAYLIKKLNLPRMTPGEFEALHMRYVDLR